MEDYKKIDSTI